MNMLGAVMANARLNEIVMKPDAPFISARLSNGGVGICPTLDALSLSIDTKDGELAKGLKAAYTELARIARHGFTVGELERARQQLLRV